MFKSERHNCVTLLYTHCVISCKKEVLAFMSCREPPDPRDREGFICLCHFRMRTTNLLEHEQWYMLIIDLLIT